MKRALFILLAVLLFTAAIPVLAVEAATDDPILAAFPKIVSVETGGGQFAFAGAPITAKTQYTLNEKTDECITVHQFQNAADAAVCFNMIDRCGLIYKGQFVYADSTLPYTYYTNTQNNSLLLYCGSNAKYNKTITGMGFKPRGGYFADRGAIFNADGTVTFHGTSTSPGSLKKVLKNSHRVLYCRVESETDYYDNSRARYKLTTMQNIKNAEAPAYYLYSVPGGLCVGKAYILFLKQSTVGNNLEEEDCGVYTSSGDGMYCPGLEVDSRGMVLPATQFGLKKQYTLNDFIKLLQKNSAFKRVAVSKDVEDRLRGVVASDTAGNVKLSLVLSKTTVKAGEPIECYAELSYTGKKKGVTVYGEPKPYFSISGGKFSKGQGMMMLDVLATQILKAEPVRFPFNKSGAYSEQDPNAAFWKAYFSEPKLLLEPGEYEITTGYSYTLDEDYAGKEYKMQATTKITVE